MFMKLNSGLYAYQDPTISHGIGFYDGKTFVAASQTHQTHQGFLKSSRYDKKAGGVVAVLLKPKKIEYSKLSRWDSGIKINFYPIVCLHGDIKYLRLEKEDNALFKEIVQEHGLMLNDNYQVLGNELLKGNLKGLICKEIAEKTLGEIVVPGEFLSDESKIEFYANQIRSAQLEYQSKMPYRRLQDVLINSDLL